MTRVKPRSLAAIAIAIAGLAASTAAEAGTPWVDHREHRQWERIYGGIQSGQLTPREAGSLLAGQARVRRLEHRFKSDGVVTVGERIRLHRALNRQSVRIWVKKHN